MTTSRGYLPCRLRTMSDVEIAWLAGWTEGEACFAIQKNNGYLFPKITVVSTDRDTIDYAYAITGVGTISKRTPQREHYLPQWAWQVGAFKDAVALMRVLLPLMKSRRAQKIREIFATCVGDEP